MAKLFSMDAADLILLRRFYKKAPKLFKRAAAGTLNAFAFGTRKQAIKVIDRKLTVRNSKFIHGSIKLDKARANVPLNRLEAITGSVVRPRYTGLAEQELGKAGPRDRTFTTASRGGNISSPVKGWARLKPNAKYPSPTNARLLTGARGGRKDFNLSGLTGSKRIVAFLSILHERKVAQTFIIHKRFGRFKRGLYRFKQGVVRKLQAFSAKHKPRRVRWLTEGRKNYFSSISVSKVWAKEISFQLKKFK